MRAFRFSVAFDHDDVFVKDIAGSIQELNKFFDTSNVVEFISGVGPFISDFDANAAIEEREFL